MRQSCVRAQRAGSVNGIIAEAQEKGWGRNVFLHPITQSLELFPIYLGTQSVLIRKKEKAHLEA